MKLNFQRKKCLIGKFDTLQKNKTIYSGGLIFSVAKDFGSLVLEASEVTNDGMMSARLECKYQIIRIILRYGRQEAANKMQRELFYDDLQIDIERGKVNGGSMLILGDLNAKLGSDYFINNHQEITQNDKMLKKIINKNQLSIVNTPEKCCGTWTRVKKTKNRI